MLILLKIAICYYILAPKNIKNQFEKQMIRKRDGEKDNTEFQKLYQKGLQCRNNYGQALEYLGRAKKVFNHDRDKAQSFTNLVIDQSRIYCKTYKYQQARMILTERLEEVGITYQRLKNKDDLLARYEQEFKLIQELAQLEGSVAERWEGEHWEDGFIGSIDKCIEYTRRAIKIAVNVLLGNESIEQLYNEQRQEWQQYYSQAIINAIDPLLIQIQKGQEQDLKIFKLIQKITQKMSDFYQLSRKSLQVQKQFSKSLYYRAIALRKSSRKYQEIQGLLLKDLSFCKKHQLQTDFQKTLTELITLYISCERVEQARKLLKTDTKKKLFNQCEYIKKQQRVQQLQRIVKSKQFRQYPQKQQKQYLQQLVSIELNDMYMWFGRFTRVGRKIIDGGGVRSQQLEYYVCYHVALAYFQIFDQNNAIDFCERALKHCVQGSIEYYRTLFLKMQIYESSSQFKEKVNDVDNEVLAVAQNFNDNREKYNQSYKYIQVRKYNQKRIMKLQEKFGETSEEKRMIKQLQIRKINRVRSHTNIQQNSDSNLEEGNYLSYNMQPQVSFMRQKSLYNVEQLKTNPQILLQKYVKLCTEKDVIQRKMILQKISQLPRDKQLLELDLGVLFQISEKQLEIYLQIIVMGRLDLRNYKITNNILQKIVQKNSGKRLKTLKIAQIHKLIKRDLVQNLFNTCRELQELHLQKIDKKFIENNQVSTTRFNFQIIYPFKLKIFKLKYSQIRDNILPFICETFTELQQLDLSMNQITGKTLSSLNKLHVLLKLNLSYNPLQVCTNELYNSSIKKLKLKNIHRPNTSSSQPLLFPQIKYLSLIDFSQNKSSTIENILQNFTKYHIQQQIQQFPYLHQIRIKKCTISSNTWRDIRQLIIFCKNIKKIDLRYSHYDLNQMNHFKLVCYQSIYNQLDVDNRGYVAIPYGNNQ